MITELAHNRISIVDRMTSIQVHEQVAYSTYLISPIYCQSPERCGSNTSTCLLRPPTVSRLLEYSNAALFFQPLIGGTANPSIPNSVVVSSRVGSPSFQAKQCLARADALKIHQTTYAGLSLVSEEQANILCSRQPSFDPKLYIVAPAQCCAWVLSYRFLASRRQ